MSIFTSIRARWATIRGRIDYTLDAVDLDRAQHDPHYRQGVQAAHAAEYAEFDPVPPRYSNEWFTTREQLLHAADDGMDDAMDADDEPTYRRAEQQWHAAHDGDLAAADPEGTAPRNEELTDKYRAVADAELSGDEEAVQQALAAYEDAFWGSSPATRRVLADPPPGLVIEPVAVGEELIERPVCSWPETHLQAAVHTADESDAAGIREFRLDLVAPDGQATRVAFFEATEEQIDDLAAEQLRAWGVPVGTGIDDYSGDLYIRDEDGDPGNMAVYYDQITDLGPDPSEIARLTADFNARLADTLDGATGNREPTAWADEAEGEPPAWQQRDWDRAHDEDREHTVGTPSDEELTARYLADLAADPVEVADRAVEDLRDATENARRHAEDATAADAYREQQAMWRHADAGRAAAEDTNGWEAGR